MWVKLNKKLSQIFNNSSKNNQSNSINDIIQTTISELEKAIQKTENLHQNTLENQKEIQSKLQDYQQKANSLYQEALEATRKGQEDYVKVKLNQKAYIDQQTEQYKVIHQNILGTLLQLEKQIEKLKLKLTETQSKKAMLSVKLENAQTQKDLSQYLSELDESGEFANYEEEIIKVELENSIVNEISALEDEFEALEEESGVDSLKSVIEEEDKRLRAEKLEQQFKKVNQIFSSQSSKEKELKLQKKKALEAKKQALLQQFMSKKQQTNATHKDNIIDDFFDTQTNEKPQSKSQSSKTDEILEQFQKTSKKTESQKRIDDFFND